MKTLSHYAPGLLLAFALAAAALAAAELPLAQHYGFSALTLAIVGGMIIGNTLYPRVAQSCHGGVTVAKQKLLRLGIILFGFKLTFQDIAAVGVGGVLIDALVLGSTFALAYWLGHRRMGLDEQSVILIGAGSSICGAAAVLATEPVLKAHAEKVAVAVATVVVFGTVAMFLWPLFYELVASLGVSSFTFGLFTGATVHEVAQVVAAGRAVSEATMDTAVITKMLRVMMLAPFLLALSTWLARRHGAQNGQQGGGITIPWFALGFLAMAGFNSLGLLPQAVVQQIIRVDTLLLATAMGALGLTTHLGAIRQAGVRPMLLAGALFVWLIVGGAAITLGVHSVLG